MASGGLWSWPSRPCEWPAKRLRGRPVSRTVTLRRARPSCRAPARPAKLPPMMMTSSMVISSVLWMEGVGLGLARNIVQRYALEKTLLLRNVENLAPYYNSIHRTRHHPDDPVDAC